MSTDTLTTAASPAARDRSLLRVALQLDAAVTGANGAAYLVLAGPVGDLLGLSPSLLRGVGAFLLVFAAAVAATASRTVIPRAAVKAIVVANLGWAAGSAIAAVAGWGDPSTAGTVWIALQALVVAGFAELQVAGLKRAVASGR